MVKGQDVLRLGYTTGSCATAAAKAATWMLLKGEPIEQVKIYTPKGIELLLDIHDVLVTHKYVSCAVVKDGGDDPDVTHGMKIYVQVSKRLEEGIYIDGGEGIGRITKVGLKCQIGEAAINPVPKQMIRQEVEAVCKDVGYMEGLEIIVFAPEGEKIAKKTFNPRLGIVGGISILGTSGIVEPMSEKALIDTIYTELEMKAASHVKQLLICPGNYGRDFAKEQLGLDLEQGIKYSNYLGETLDHIVYLGFEKVLLVGHIGKLVKVAAGVMNTHSKYADARFEVLASHAAMEGVPKEIICKVMECVTTDGALSILKEQPCYKKVIASILNKIQRHINFRVKDKVQVEIILFGEEGILAKTKEVQKSIQRLQMEVEDGE